MSEPNNIAIFGEHDAKTIAQLEDVASRAERAALMADGLVGYVMPIGGVAAYRDQVSLWASASTSPAATRPSVRT
jgi:tRNA-splicing ligase RtcB